MAGGFAASTGSTKKYAGRVTAFVVVTCLVSATGGLIFGYDLGISGGVTSMDPFLKKFFPNVFRKLKRAHTNAYCKFDDQLLTTFTSSLYIAGLIASFFASASTRLLGRKMSILFGGSVFLTGAVLNGAAVNVAMLILGRICLGIGVGFANQVESRRALPSGERWGVNNYNMCYEVKSHGVILGGERWGFNCVTNISLPSHVVTFQFLEFGYFGTTKTRQNFL